MTVASDSITALAHVPADELAQRWRTAFLRTIEPAEVASPLRENAVPGKLANWTSHLTGAVVASCEALGLRSAAKGHPLDLLAESRQEYMGLDVTAFLPNAAKMDSWSYPLAAFELENSPSDDRVAYSIWKVASVRSVLGVVFAYRNTWDEAAALVRTLAKAVPIGFAPGQHWAHRSESEIILVMGSRSDNEAFPWGYFKFWSFNRNTRLFEKL